MDQTSRKTPRAYLAEWSGRYGGTWPRLHEASQETGSNSNASADDTEQVSNSVNEKASETSTLLDMTERLTWQDICCIKPTFGDEERDHGRCVRDLQKLGCPIIEVPDCPYIDMARAALVTHAKTKHPQARIYVFIDHDIIFNAHDVLLLAQHLQDSDYAVLGSLYSMRRPMGGIIGRPQALPSSEMFYTPGLIDGAFVGMGFTAVKVSTFQRLDEDLPEIWCPSVRVRVRPYFLHLVVGDVYIGEDVSFCHRVVAAGMKIGIDKQFRILHRGKYDYALEDVGICVPDKEQLQMNFSA